MLEFEDLEFNGKKSLIPLNYENSTAYQF